jgi:hypothetical protein
LGDVTVKGGLVCARGITVDAFNGLGLLLTGMLGSFSKLRTGHIQLLAELGIVPVSFCTLVFHLPVEG